MNQKQGKEKKRNWRKEHREMEGENGRETDGMKEGEKYWVSSSFSAQSHELLAPSN